MTTEVIERNDGITVIEIGIPGPQGPPGTLIEVAEDGAVVVTPVREFDFGTGFDVTNPTFQRAQIDLDLSEIDAGGELAGPMDAPTVNALHSGSTHQSISDALNAHEIDVVGAHDASAVAFTPADTITSADTQGAIVEALTDARAYTDDGHVILSASRGAVDGVAELDATGKVPSSELPAFSLGEVFTVASQAAMLALSAVQGDMAVRTDVSQTFILSALPASTLGNWVELLNPGSPVTSVNTRTGSVTGLEEASNKGAIGGYAALDGSGYVPDTQLNPTIARDTEVSDAVTAHNVAADPHTGYQKESERAAASGYASLDSGTKVPIAQVPTGTTSSTVALGDAPAAALSTAEAYTDTHVADVSAAHAASAVAFTPAGTVAATDVQAAIGELATDYAAADTAHVGAPDPHTGYLRENGVIFNVMDAPYSAVADGTTNDTAAIVAAIAACPTRGTVYFPPGKTFLISLGSIVFTTQNVEGTGATLKVTQTGSGVAVDVGNGLAEFTGYTYKLPMVRYQGTGFGSSWQTGSVGVRVRGLYTSVLDLQQIEGFEKGLYMSAGANGAADTAYAQVRFTDIVSNKVNIYIDAGTGTSFNNEVQYYGSRMGHAAGYGTNNANCHNIKIVNTSSSLIDMHKFWGLNIESNAKENFKDIVTDGNTCQWYACRFESTSPGVVFNSGANNNQILGGLFPSAFTITDNGLRNLVLKPPMLTSSGNTLNVLGLASAGAVSGDNFAGGSRSYLKHFAGTWTTAANEKCDLNFSGVFIGSIVVELQGSFGSTNRLGTIRKRFSLGVTAAGTAYLNSSTIEQASGNAPSTYAIGEWTWDSGTSTWRLPIVHRDTLAERFEISVITEGLDAAHLTTAQTLALGSRYTTDATTYPAPSTNNGVATIAKSGDTALTGAVTISAGSGISLTEAGQDIAIAATGGGAAASYLSIAKWGTD